ncbi:HEAT repeat protein [Planctomycetes bacterium Pla163]|uniref:HEAT repeat protein n=1 Tax=Rohdeia mirabilis TaxID=2528008 RepID=A0A518D0Z7_9BACT|nr:HEAT repeat protein [Planctomycetes bacterium Pla163]
MDAALAAAPAAPVPEPLPPEALDEFDHLLGFVVSSSGALRRAGAEDLWRLGDGVALALVDALYDTERTTDERSAALEVLGSGAHDAANPLLLEVLTSGPDAWMRSSAAWYLGELVTEGWICDAVLRLKYETDESVVVYLAQALGKHDVLAGLSGLRVISRSSWSEQQRTTAEALIAELTAEVEVPVGEPQPRDTAFDRAVWSWIARLGEFQLRGVDDARFILTNLGADVAPHLARALSDDDRYVRLHACQCLERMGSKGSSAADALVEQLGSQDLGPHAAVALGTVTQDSVHDRARTLLLELVHNEAASPGLRLGAARGLARHRSRLSLEGVLTQFERERERWPELAQALAEAAVSIHALEERDLADPERDRRVDAAYRFAIACLDTPGLDPASTGAVWEESFLPSSAALNQAERPELAPFETLEADWNAIGERRGPEFGATAMWRARKALLESALVPVLR